MANVNLIDLFCGTGGFSIGFEHATRGSYRTLLGVDLLPKSIETFRRNHKSARGLAGDIRKIRRSDLSGAFALRKNAVDLIIGGPPCQGFSSIRPFRSSNEDDPRNSLFEEFASFVNWFRPKAFVLENVVGLATHEGGRTIAAMQECFHGLGYACDWKILNAAHFGVPQKRERLILLGVQRGGALRFPEPTHWCESDTIGYRDATKMLRPEAPDLFRPTRKLSKAVSVMDAIGDLPPIQSGEEATRYTLAAATGYQRARRSGSTQLTLHSSTRHTPKMLEIIKHSGPNISYIPKHLVSSGFSSCYSRLAADEPAVTITVNFVHPASNRCIHPLLDRALTPREGARLQSFDDAFEFVGNRSQITKQIGNAVPPLLGTAIAECLAPTLA